MRPASLLLSLALSGLLFAPAQAQPCTRTGTNQHDHLNGTEFHDVICLRAGDDYSNAREAPDTIYGGRGSDTLVGGDGPDTLRGLLGNDDLFAVDESTNDILDGGFGRDNCYGDRGDTFIDCERRVRV